MKTIFKSAVVAIALFIILIADVPFLFEQEMPILLKQNVQTLFEQMVPEAHAVLGVRRRTRRRTAVVVGSAAAAQTAAAQQQTAAAQQQAAAAQQQAAAQSAPTVPIGTVVQTLPGSCTAVTVSGASYSDCGGVFYKAAFQGNNLVYVVVEKPLK